MGRWQWEVGGGKFEVADGRRDDAKTARPPHGDFQKNLAILEVHKNINYSY